VKCDPDIIDQLAEELARKRFKINHMNFSMTKAAEFMNKPAFTIQKYTQQQNFK
jgi:hypothetical protein